MLYRNKLNFVQELSSISVVQVFRSNKSSLRMSLFSVCYSLVKLHNFIFCLHHKDDSIPFSALYKKDTTICDINCIQKTSIPIFPIQFIENFKDLTVL